MKKKKKQKKELGCLEIQGSIEELEDEITVSQKPELINFKLTSEEVVEMWINRLEIEPYGKEKKKTHKKRCDGSCCRKRKRYMYLDAIKSFFYMDLITFELQIVWC